MGGILSRDQILAADDLPSQTLEIPEWGGSVIVRGLTGSERSKFEQEIVDMKRPGKPEFKWDQARELLVALTVVDESAQRLFTEKDVRALGKKSAAALDRIYNVAMRLAGLSDDDMDELEKN